jgi:hypothetical protein
MRIAVGLAAHARSLQKKVELSMRAATHCGIQKPGHMSFRTALSEPLATESAVLTVPARLTAKATYVGALNNSTSATQSASRIAKSDPPAFVGDVRQGASRLPWCPMGGAIQFISRRFFQR